MDLENIGLVFIKIELYRPWFFKGTAIDSILKPYVFGEPRKRPVTWNNLKAHSQV